MKLGLKEKRRGRSAREDRVEKKKSRDGPFPGGIPQVVRRREDRDDLPQSWQPVESMEEARSARERRRTEEERDATHIDHLRDEREKRRLEQPLSFLVRSFLPELRNAVGYLGEERDDLGGATRKKK